MWSTSNMKRSMSLSEIYHNREFVIEQNLWVMVYHTQPGSDNVEMVEEKFFKSKKKAWKWFHKYHKVKHFIQPEPFQIGATAKVRIHSGVRYVVPDDQD